MGVPTSMPTSTTSAGLQACGVRFKGSFTAFDFSYGTCPQQKRAPPRFRSHLISSAGG